MANGRNSGCGARMNRDGSGFIALPWLVVDAPAYRGLSHPARSLMMELARQVAPDGSNNGQLLASRKYLARRGWKSADVIFRAKQELLEAGFIHETVRGHRPNKASWYAVTWRPLVRHTRYDLETFDTFERGAYRENASLVPARRRESSQQALLTG